MLFNRSFDGFVFRPAGVVRSNQPSIWTFAIGKYSCAPALWKLDGRHDSPVCRRSRHTRGSYDFDFLSRVFIILCHRGGLVAEFVFLDFKNNVGPFCLFHLPQLASRCMSSEQKAKVTCSASWKSSRLSLLLFGLRRLRVVLPISCRKSKKCAFLLLKFWLSFVRISSRTYGRLSTARSIFLWTLGPKRPELFVGNLLRMNRLPRLPSRPRRMHTFLPASTQSRLSLLFW